MFSWLYTNLIWSEGLAVVLVLVCSGLLAFIVYRPLVIIFIGLLLFSVYFFRNPDRICEQAFLDNSIIVCPADGKIVDIQHDPTGNLEGYFYRVSIFLSPFDVHVNWAPVAGNIESVIYKPGIFTMAFLPKSSLLNERNDILIHTDNGTVIVVRQIAGTIARRICCWVAKGDVVRYGTKIGMIRFGSRVDIFLPKTAQIYGLVGQRVYGGQTVLGRLT